MKKRRGGWRGEKKEKSEASFYCSQNLSPRFETCSSCQRAAGPHASRSSRFPLASWGLWGGVWALGLGEGGRVGGFLWDLPPTSTPSFIYLFIYIPAYYLIPPIFHGCHIPTSTAKT